MLFVFVRQVVYRVRNSFVTVKVESVCTNTRRDTGSFTMLSCVNELCADSLRQPITQPLRQLVHNDSAIIQLSNDCTADSALNNQAGVALLRI